MTTGAVPPLPRERGGAPVTMVAGSGVDGRLLRLAGVVNGSDVVALPSAGEPRRVPNGRRALVVADQVGTPRTELRVGVDMLDRAGVAWGLVLAADPLLARFALLKALLVQIAPTTGRAAVISGSYATPFDIAGPSTSGHADDRPGALFTSRCDVLLLNGHANAFDASVGPGAVLCARAGRIHDRGPAVLPCFNDGTCFRQPSSGGRRLVALMETDATVLVLSGCELMPLGPSWFRAESSLAHQAAASRSLATIVSSDVSQGVLELDLLTMALIADGRPLGEVVRAVNDRRRRHGGPGPGTGTGASGPFVLLGNPALVLTGSPPVPVPCRSVPLADGGRRWHIDLTDVGPLPAEGALVRAEMTLEESAPFLLLQRRSPDGWCRGVHHAGAGGGALYAWVAGAGAQELVVDTLGQEPWQPVRGVLAGHLANGPFWTLFLEDCRQALAGADRSTEPIERLQADTPSLIRTLASGDVALRAPAGVLIDEAAGDAVCAALWRMLHGWQRRLLDAVVHGVAEVGRLHSYGSSPYLHLVRSLESAGPCPCGEGTLTRQVFETSGGQVRRVEALCATCGGGIDDDGRHRVLLERQPVGTLAIARRMVQVAGAPGDRHPW
ncbi:hypothetical protein [Frankia canadensis]|uniref:hypothetical protein n=1 Tax=Frankia canadensis TaxID=1836972 RepID=UPI001055A0AA|nr:hypothetical protein [Frankia canadensis]